ncbi:unnamed protein product [Ectocarpus sp. 6 AP-2014]
MAMSYVMSAVSLMLVDFPGLRWKGSLKCPQHGDGMLFANKATRGGGRFLEGSRCPQCSADTGGLGAAAIDLLRLVDIRLDRDVIFNEVKARFDNLESHYSFAFPTDPSKEEGELIRKIDGVATAVKGVFEEVKVELKGGFGMIKGSLDKLLESTQDSLMRLKNLQAPNYRYPRLVVVKEVGSDGASSMAHGKKGMLSKLRGLGKKDMTLHFLCPVDMTKVPCGYGGEGYRFRETRGWVKKLSPVLQAAVVTAKVALNATTGLNMDISDFLKDVKDGLVEELVDQTLDEEALLRAVSGEDDVGADLQKVTRASYEALKRFIDKEQVDRVENARDGDGYIDFRDEMKRVNDGRGGMVWVRNENVQKWLDSHATAAPTR